MARPKLNPPGGAGAPRTPRKAPAKAPPEPAKSAAATRAEKREQKRAEKLARKEQADAKRAERELVREQRNEKKQAEKERARKARGAKAGRKPAARSKAASAKASGGKTIAAGAKVKAAKPERPKRKRPKHRAPGTQPTFNLAFLFTLHGLPYLLTPFIAIAIALDLTHASPSAIFICSALGVIPTAALMGRATEELAARSGPGIGGLLNVTFGNAPELIIALFALNAGLHEVVKASIVGSIIGNILLVMGAAMFAGGLGRKKQKFQRTTANAQSSMLFLAATALVMPAVFELVEGRGLPGVNAELIDFGSTVETLSLVVALVLMFSYVSGLVFSLRTHADLFNPSYEDEDTWGWSARRATVMLAVAGIAVGVMSEILVGSIGEAATSLGLSEFFVGAVVIAIVGNAAEHWVAVLVARKDKMDLSVNIAIGSSAQVALFVAPVLVLASFLIGPVPMPLVFNGFEVAAVLLAVLIANAVTNEGESTWFEGLQLLLVYLVLAIAFGFA